MKFRPYLIAIFLVMIVILSIYLERKNTLRIKEVIDCDKVDSVLFKKLANLVDENRFNRQYYEVILYRNAGCQYYYVLNYNTKFQLLSLSTDPCSGFSVCAKVNQKELFKIADSDITVENFQRFYKGEYQKEYGILPTRACKISVFDLIFE